MSIKIPAQIANQNPSFPLIRAEDNEVAGIGFFTSIAGRQNLPTAKRTNSFIANMSLSDGTSYIAVFTGDINTDGDWADGRKWAAVANEENVFDIFTAAATRRNNTTDDVGEFTNGILGDYDQDGKVNVDDFLSFLTGYVATASTSTRTGNTASDRLSGIIGNTTEHLATWEFENYDGTNDFMLATTKAIEEQISLRDLFFTDRTLSSAVTHTLEDTFRLQNNLDSNMLSVSGTAVTVGAYSLPLVDGEDRQFLMSNGDGTASWAYVQGTFLRVQNDETVEMRAGTPVYAKGLQGNTILVGKADADDPTKMPCIGVIYGDTLAASAKGQAITSGLINKDITGLTGVQVGDTLYVSTTGTLTRVKPTGASSLIQNVGTVLEVNGDTAKKTKISAIDRTNDIPNISAGKFMVGTASYPQESFFTVPSSFGGAGQVLTADGSGGTSWQTPTGGGGGEVVDDTTPQLGGDLDVNGFKITSASNGDIVLDPDGFGAIVFKSDSIQFDGDGTFSGGVKLYESDVLGGNSIKLSAPLSVTSDVTLYLPDGEPTAGQTMGTLGNGVLRWEDKSPIQATTGSEQYYGDIITLGTGPGGVTSAIEAGKIYYLDSTQQWEEADATTASTSTSLLALATANGSNRMMLRGVARHVSWAGLGHGSQLFLSETAGEVTTTAPSATGSIVRCVGFCTNGSTREIYFNPSSDNIEN